MKLVRSMSDLCPVLLLLAALPAAGATLCVQTNGGAGCYSHISDAIVAGKGRGRDQRRAGNVF